MQQPEQSSFIGWWLRHKITPETEIVYEVVGAHAGHIMVEDVNRAVSLLALKDLLADAGGVCPAGGVVEWLPSLDAVRDAQDNEIHQQIVAELEAERLDELAAIEAREDEITTVAKILRQALGAHYELMVEPGHGCISFRWR